MSETDDKTGRAGSGKVAIAFAERTDVGKKRNENQDALGHANFAHCRLFVVCDGMGGHAGGSTASRLAVDTILESCRAATDEAPPRERLERAILAANKRVFQAAKSDKGLKGMGTTVVALLLDTEEGVARVAHVGDSRVYLARGSTFRRLTRDHTMVQQMVDDGILTEGQAAGHPHGNVISRSLGGGRTVEVEHLEAPLELQPGDLFLLCTDGLTGPVEEEEIAEILWGNKPRAATAALVARANAAGGDDNVSVQIVRFGPPASRPARIEIEHPEGKPSGLLDELKRRAEALASGLGTKEGRMEGGAVAAGGGGTVLAGGEEEEEDQEAPLWPQADGDSAELASPVLPAVLLGLFIAIVAFLAVYLAVEQVTPPPPEEGAAVEETEPVEETDEVEIDEGAPF